MNKEKLKEFLDSKELWYFRNKYIEETGKELTGFLQYLDQKRKELEEPTYKTEDGFEVKDGDSVYYIFLSNNSIYPLTYNALYASEYKAFKLKENAENYLVKNAEVLSYKDIQEYHDYYYANYQNIKSTDDFLKQKIREKLKL